MTKLSESDIKREEKFLQGIPRINVGALILPAIWGPGHGLWVAILFYPLWILADSLIFAAWSEPKPLSIVLACITLLILLLGSVVFSLLGQPLAAHKAAAKGVSKEDYLKREKIWTIVCVVLALAAVAWASYYNIMIRPDM